MKNNEIIRTAYEKVFTAYDNDKFISVFTDLLERCEYDISDSTTTDELYDIICENVDNGLIYTADLWAVYMHYCNMGDSTDFMYNDLYDDLYTVLNNFIND